MPPKKGRQPSKTRIQKKTKAPEEDQAHEEAPRRSPTPPPLEIQVEVHAADDSRPTAAAAGDQAAAVDDQAAAVDESEEDARPVGKGKGKSKGKAIAKHDYSLEAEVEASVLEWMAEHDEVWRRGHRLYKKRREIWAAKADELGLQLDHIMGWWKSVKDWYVRLTRVKSGQAAKKYTDREKYIIKRLQFYKTQLPSTKFEPMLSLPRTSTQTSRVSDSDPDSDQEEAPRSQEETPTHLEDDLEAVERTSAEATQSSSQTSSRQLKKRRKREVDHEEEWMKELRGTMKANQQLLTQLIQEKPAQSEREAFIKYVADSLRAAPAEHYKQMKTKICAVIDSQDPAPAPEPARPAHVMSAPPVLHQHVMYEQQPLEHYQQQQHVQQYQQQPVKQYQQQKQPTQQYKQQEPASGDRWSSGSLTQILHTSQEVLDGSLNLSAFSVDSADSELFRGPGSNRRNSSQSLNTPPAPKPQRDDNDSD